MPSRTLKQFEIPDRYVLYIRHYAEARALEREGEGQDLELAQHYQQRYEAGIQRILKRQEAMRYQQKFVKGGSLKNIRTKKPLVQLPWPFGRTVR